MRTINIMTSCDDNLALYILPQIVSINANLAEYKVNFFLFHYRISDENIEIIKNFISEFKNITFREIKVKNIESYKEMVKYGGKWPEEAYFSFDCHKYLPSYVNRILYIDAGDIIINGDIEEYYFADFEGKTLIATPVALKAPEWTEFMLDDLNDFDFFARIARGILNSGSYVINVEKFRKQKLKLLNVNYFLKTILKVYPDNFPLGDKIYFGDQGLISLFFVDHIKYFGIEKKNVYFMPYNFCIWFYDRYDKLEEYEPKIVHFCGRGFKPWKSRLETQILPPPERTFVR